MDEQWKPIAGWEDAYEVSTYGNVRMRARSVRYSRFDFVLMRQHVHMQGYRVVWFRRSGVHKKYFVHRLVAITFLQNPEAKEIVNHKDGVRHNNRLTNLEWVTQSENVRHGNVRRNALQTTDMEF